MPCFRRFKNQGQIERQDNRRNFATPHYGDRRRQGILIDTRQKQDKVAGDSKENR